MHAILKVGFFVEGYVQDCMWFIGSNKIIFMLNEPQGQAIFAAADDMG